RMVSAKLAGPRRDPPAGPRLFGGSWSRDRPQWSLRLNQNLDRPGVTVRRVYLGDLGEGVTPQCPVRAAEKIQAGRPVLVAVQPMQFRADGEGVRGQASGQFRGGFGDDAPRRLRVRPERVLAWPGLILPRVAATGGEGGADRDTTLWPRRV